MPYHELKSHLVKEHGMDEEEVERIAADFGLGETHLDKHPEPEQ